MAASLQTHGDLTALLAGVRSGDDAAFVALIVEYKPLVFRWAVALSGDGDDAEDITQEVYVRVYARLSTFRGDGSFDGWLYSITRRVLLKMRRKSSRHERLAPVASNNVYVTDPGARVDRQRAVALIRGIAES